MTVVRSLSFANVPEWKDEFLSLWPHRYDYIWAEHPYPGQNPEWKTESRHPLSDRLIRQGSHLYGVRFGALTNYCLIDIDIGSPYHPRQDPFAIARILAALEPLGLVAHLACTSSYSGGLHVYFPFEVAQKSSEVAIALQSLLHNAGFKPAPGQLELFPNPKPYNQEDRPSLYAAHRLPMQAGSYLMTFQGGEWDLIGGDQTLFATRWQFAQARNDVTPATLAPIVKAARLKQYCLSGKADKFLNDLNADIEPGWSDHGQTNYILGRITLRAYVFGHILQSCDPLEGTALVDEVVRTARSLPGYQDWCRHQHELEKRAEEWASCVENSHYFHYGTDPKGKYRAKSVSLQELQPLSWNQQQAQSARSRIQAAIADLLNQDVLPATATARFEILTVQYRIGGQTLYRHRDLWHPACLETAPPDYLKDHPFDPHPVSATGAPDVKPPKSFLYPTGCNTLPDQPSEPKLSNVSEDVGRNLLLVPQVQHLSLPPPAALDGPHYVQQVLFEIQQRRQQQRTAPKPALDRVRSPEFLAREQAQAERMRQYLESGDPILMAEAMPWFLVRSNLE